MPSVPITQHRLFLDTSTFQEIIMKSNRANRNNRQQDNDDDKVLPGIKVMIIGIIASVFINKLIFPEPIYNYGQPEKFVADEYGRKIELEAKLDRGTGNTGRIVQTTYYPQLYIYLHGERMMCFFHEDNMELTRTLRGYLGNRKIELSEATLAIADGQKRSILKSRRIRYCSIIKIKFKNFSDVENLAKMEADNVHLFGVDNRTLYNSSLERYKKLFY